MISISSPAGQNNQHKHSLLQTLSILAREKSVFERDESIFFHLFLKTVAAALGVNRCTIWKIGDREYDLTCIASFENSLFSMPQTIISADVNPDYFSYITEVSALAITDVEKHPATKGYWQPYYKPACIRSVIECGITESGELTHLFCIENTHSQRVWDDEECLFATACAELLCSLFLDKRRINAEKNLRRSNADLEKSVKEKTQEIQSKILQLEQMNSQLAAGSDEVIYAYSQLNKKQEMLELQAQELERANTELIARNAQLEKLSAKMEATIIELSRSNDELELRKSELESAFLLMEEQKGQLEEQTQKISQMQIEQEIINTDLMLRNKELEEVSSELEKTIKQLQNTNEELELRKTELESAFLQLAESNQKMEEQAAVIEAINDKLTRRNSDLQELLSLKGEFLAIAAHDLKNPLASIMLRSENLGKMAADSTKFDEKKLRTFAHQTAEWVHNLSQRMFEIVSSLLKYEEVESGQIVLTFREINLPSLLSEVFEANKERAHKKGIELVLENVEETSVFGDDQKLYEVFDNLISNALKFSLPQTKVSIFTNSPRADKIEVCVKDEGPGIPEEDKPKLFEKYKKLTAKPTGGESSTGLGLSIVKKIVELHEGDISVDSKEREGATFIVSLPLADKEE